MRYNSNMYVNDVVVGLPYSSEKERMRIIQGIERKKKKDRTIRGIEVDEKRCCVLYVYKNDFRNFH